MAPEVGLDQLTYANPPKDVVAYRPEAKKPWLDRQRSVRTKAQIDGWLEATRRRSVRRFEQDELLPQTNGVGSTYQCKGCPAKPLCPAWAGHDGGPLA